MAALARKTHPVKIYAVVAADTRKHARAALDAAVTLTARESRASSAPVRRT